jgi:hypothetical protein
MGRSSRKAANILAGKSLNLNSSKPEFLDHLSDNVFSTPVPEYVGEEQIGVSINLLETRNSLLEKISIGSNTVLAPGITNQEVGEFLTKEVSAYSNILSWALDWDLEADLQFQYPGQKSAIRKPSAKANLFLATVLDVDFKKVKSAAALNLYNVSVKDLNSLEEVIEALQKKYHNHDIITRALFDSVNQLSGSPLKVACQ